MKIPIPRPSPAALLLAAGLALPMLPAAAAADEHAKAPADEHAEAAAEANLKDRIEEQFERDPWTQDYDLVVDVDGDKVVLRGQVQKDYESERAVELAKGVEGVKSVQNNIVVAPSDPDDLPPESILTPTGVPTTRPTGP